MRRNNYKVPELTPLQRRRVVVLFEQQTRQAANQDQAFDEIAVVTPQFAKSFQMAALKSLGIGRKTGKRYF